MVQFNEIPVGDPKFTILNYVNNQRSGTRLSEYLKHNYQNSFNQLIMNLVTANYQSEADVIINI